MSHPNPLFDPQDFNDILSLVGLSNRRSEEMYQHERHCRNCIHGNECLNLYEFPLPQQFNFRRSGKNGPWTSERFKDHVGAMYGQICQNFTPNSPEARHRILQRQRTQEDGWDIGDNT